MWKKKEKKEEEKEEDLLKELCGDDKKLYDLLSSSLYINPIMAIPKTDLESLIEEGEKCIKDENYQGAMAKYQTAVDKAIFEAAQNPEEKARYIKVIQDLSLKAAKVIEKTKEKGEKEGFVAPSLEGRIKHYKYMSERTEDVIKIASLVYNERLEDLGTIERREERSIKRGESRGKEERVDKEAKDRREKRGKERKEMDGEERREAEKKDREEEKNEKERKEERNKEGIEAEAEEKRTEEEEKERREKRREEMRETRKT